MIKQLAKDGSYEGGFSWQAKPPSFGRWKPPPDVRHIAPLTRPTPVPGSAYRACARVFRLGILTPCHGHATDSPGKPGCLAPLSNPWNIISTFSSYSLQIFKRILGHAHTAVTPPKRPARATARACTAARDLLLPGSLKHFHPGEKCVGGV